MNPSIPSISHPSNRPNFSVVRTTRGAIAYSYATPIAFATDDTPDWVVRVNEWGPTTGKHLNWCSIDKGARLDGPTFEARLTEAFQ